MVGTYIVTVYVCYTSGKMIVIYYIYTFAKYLNRP